MKNRSIVLMKKRRFHRKYYGFVTMGRLLRKKRVQKGRKGFHGIKKVQMGFRISQLKRKLKQNLTHTKKCVH